MHRKFKNREQAGCLLAKKLEAYRNTNAIVVGVPAGGVSVGAAIARTLSLPFAVLPCRKVTHPGDRSKTIGSVCADEVFLGHCSPTIPQDYIYHQIALLKNALKHDKLRYYGDKISPSFHYKTILLVDDVLLSGDAILASIRGIRKRRPLKIILSVPVVSTEAARIVNAEADDFLFLQMNSVIGSPQEYFIDFSEADSWEMEGAFTGIT